MSDQINSTLASMTNHPGVYRMLNDKDEVIYVGKAKNLKKRVSSYFSKQVQSKKTEALVKNIVNIETTVTQSETEALLLEQSLIKKYRPPYNILLRDDKSYPFIHVSNDGDYPKISFHRGLGKQNKKGQFFGPYPSTGAVRETLSLMQKVFKVRQCEDAFFRNRSRPCLQYQIERCSGPCVGAISVEDYQEDLQHTLLFLEGKSLGVSETLSEKMDAASDKQDYELAAKYRDQIIAVRRVQEQQSVLGESGDVDVVAVQLKPGACSVHVLYIEGGRVLGSKNFFPKIKGEWDEQDVLLAFLSQFYLEMSSRRKIPKTVLLSHELENESDSEGEDDGKQNEIKLLEQAISEKYETKIQFQTRVRGEKAAWLKLAIKNAEQSLISFLANKQNVAQRFQALQDALQLDDLPERIECYDISHTMGEATIGSCVVFNTDGPVKTDYRRFNIEGITAGDDYAAMSQVLERRYTRLKKGEGKIPDVIFVDGGKGQLSQAIRVLEELQVEGFTLVGVAKGVTRKAGLEHLFLYQDGEAVRELTIETDSPALHLIQHIRDESHRFAIAGHRQKRGKKRMESPLQNIQGVGPKRRKALLSFFGGWKEIERASVNELAKVPGISKDLAQNIYSQIHD